MQQPSALFRYMGRVENPEPHHYATEAQTARFLQSEYMRQGQHAAAYEERDYAERCESVVRRARWNPSRLSSAAMAERLTGERKLETCPHCRGRFYNLPHHKRLTKCGQAKAA